MTKTTDKISSFSARFYRNYHHLLAFLLPAFILWVAYCCFGVYPISNNSVLALDLNGQYANYFDYMYDVFAGKESLFYSWSRNLSGEFMGIIGYYLASPFNFLVWIFPREHLTEGLLVMILSKVGTAGLFCSLYLYRGRKLNRGTAVLFSMMYALSAYTITQTMNPMWLDGVLILPLVVFGIESLIYKGHFRLLTGALIYAFVTNFYIGFMIAIFTALYFIYFFFASEELHSMNLKKALSKFGIFTLSAIIGAACSAFMLIPVYNSLKLGKFEFSVPDYSNIISNFNLIEFADKLLPNSYDTVRMSGTPLIYCGLLTVIMAVCYFFGGKKELISKRKRICGAALLFILAASMYIRPVDILWHGGQLPNWLPYRYSFMISFLLVAWGAEAFNRISNISGKTIGAVSGGFFALMVLLESKDNFDPDLGNKGRELLDGITVILPAVLILFILTAVLIQLKNKINRNLAVILTLGVLITGELFYNTLTTIYKQHTDITYSSRDSYVNYFTPVREVTDEIKAKDPGFYRMEKNFYRTSNDEIALSMYGLSHSSSTMNTSAIDFLGHFGMTSHSHNTRYSGATPLIDDLFGVKYILSSKNNETNTIKTSSDITVEENPDAMPIAYLVDSGVSQLDLSLTMDGEDKNNKFSPQSKLLAYMIGKHSIPEYFTLLDTDEMTVTTENLTPSVSGTHTVYKVAKSGSAAEIRYNVVSDRDGELFLWLPSDYPRRIDVHIERSDGEGGYKSVFAGGFFKSDYYRILSLGEFSNGEEFTLRFKLTEDEVYYKDIYIAGLNTELYNKDYGILREMNADTQVEKLSQTHLKITVNSDVERLLLTTVPAEPGWIVTVNGEKTEYQTALGALISVPVSSGESIIEMRFVTNGYPIALCITLGGIAVFALMCIIFYVKRKNTERQTEERKLYDSYDNTGVSDNDVDIEDFEDDISGMRTGKVYVGDYDENRVMRNIESIVNDINEINSFEQLEFEETTEEQSEDNLDIEDFQDKKITSALDLFPDDEIAKLWENDDNKER